MNPIIEERYIVLADADATLSAGAAIAPHLIGGMVVTLSGELGAGKTTLVRGALRRLGWLGAVKSPSYTLVEHYAISSLYFYHFDFYRFNDHEEWDSTGFSEYFLPTAVCLIEWPERVASRLPVVDLALVLSVQGSGRALHLSARTLAGKGCLVAFAAALP